MKECMEKVKKHVHVILPVFLLSVLSVIVLIYINKGCSENAYSEKNTEDSVSNDTKAGNEVNNEDNPMTDTEANTKDDDETNTGAETEVNTRLNVEMDTKTDINSDIDSDTKADINFSTESNTKADINFNTEFDTETDIEENLRAMNYGVLHTKEAIQYVRYAVEHKISPNYETWEALLSSPLSDAKWQPRAVETVIRGGNGDNVSKLYIDVARAYQCALIWTINGSQEHGKAACRILNSWSSTLKTITGNADRYLASGLFGYQLANISELMREHEDFDIKAMQDMLLNVFYYPLNERFLVGNQYGKDHNDAYISNYYANWDLCNMASAMAIGIFCDRKDIYDKAVEYFKSGLGNGSIYNAIPYVYEDGTAQWQESGRDQGHTNLGLGLMACICEMAWNQGDDLYGMSDNRLLKAAEYIAKYNNGEEVQFSEYEWGSGTKGDIKYHTVISESGRGEVRPIWSMIYNHYVGRMGLEAPNVKKRLEAMKIECGAVSGGHATTYDQPGWGTLMFAGNSKWSRDNIKKDNGDITDGIYRIVSVHTGKALSVNVNGALCQCKKSNEKTQLWHITYIGGGEYKLENLDTGNAMTVEDCSYANGAIINTLAYAGKINQSFAILKDGENYRIIASNSGKAIDIRDWSDRDDAEIFQWRYVMGNNQRWILERVD